MSLCSAWIQVDVSCAFRITRLDDQTLILSPGKRRLKICWQIWVRLSSKCRVYLELSSPQYPILPELGEHADLVCNYQKTIAKPSNPEIGTVSWTASTGGGNLVTSPDGTI